MYTKESVAVTLTTELPKDDYQSVTLLQIDPPRFLPSQPVMISLDQDAFVHYEPKKSQVVFGTNSVARHTKLKLTVQQFAWIIQQLNEENYASDSVQSIYATSENVLYATSSVIGFFRSKRARSLKTLLHLVQPRVARDKIHCQCIFMPKELLLQAASLIPSAKPLPPLPDISYAPCELLSTPILTRLKRYCRYVSFCSHELLMSLHTPECSQKTVSVQCAECSLDCGLESIDKAPYPPTYEQKTVMFPVSYVRYTLDSESNESDSENSDDSLSPQKYGYVAVDTASQEIVVVFPGMTTSRHMFENVSFGSTAWLELDTDAQGWVLECAHTAWRRCDVKVVTLLMRLCSIMPPSYKVVIVGHSLGGALACLCASSLRTTKLLTDRTMTVCTLFSPRVGNQAFLDSIQGVEIIRMINPAHIMTHLPPSTSGLLHAGDSTVVVTAERDCLFENGTKFQDTLLTPSTQDNTVWGIELDNDKEKCIRNLL
ncbi:hypothetical protein G6F56_006724 [Rhizopus delemar]|nr:hypothetical protein G6F56_006724 [Rhizopus delemar]